MQISPISPSLDKNMTTIKQTFIDCEDVILREFLLKGSNQKVLMVYTDNIVDGAAIGDFIMTSLMSLKEVTEPALEQLMLEGISIGEVGKVTSYEEINHAVLLGDTILLMDNQTFALQVSTKNFPTRGVGHVETEVVVQGPKDAFTESMALNVVLIRRRIRDVGLKLKRKTLGNRTKTDISMMYFSDLVQPELLAKIERQLGRIQVDGILDSGYVEQLMERRWTSPFPQLQMTERPDKVAAALLEGRVALVVDNTPFVVLLPVTLNVFFQAAEDYYDRWEMASVIRVLRYVAAFVALALPGLYVAFSLYHPQLLPTALAIKIAQTRQSIPFSVMGEILIMELAFELLREAGIRLPSPVSSTVGIVGGIIIGSAAVEAGIVSPVVVIVSALTGICSFVIPSVSFVSGIRLSKYVVLFFSAFLGLFGFWLSMLLLLTHLSGLTSYGIPYLYPFCSSSVNQDVDWEDSLIRLPLRKMKHNPIFTRADARPEGKEEE